MELENRLILAPLGGMLRLPVRLAYRRLGAAMTCVGAIDARAVALASTDDLVNILGKRETTSEEERPVCVQLVGGDAETLAVAALRVQRYTSVIDLNFSGPTRRMVGKGHGAAILRNPALMKEILTAVAGSVSIPVTAKIRIGFEGPDVDAVRLAQNCQDAGAAAIVVHARFVCQRYCGPAHWEWIQRIKQNVDIPVIGNGGVYSPPDARAMIEQTGCDFVMIGTAAFVNPLIFRQTNELLDTGRCRDAGNVRALLAFFRHYHTCAKRVESRGTLKFLRRSCRDFLRARAYLQRIQTGQTTLE